MQGIVKVRAPLGHGRTVLGVTTTRTATARRTLPSIEARARELLTGERPTGRSATTDVERALLDAASIVLTELRALQELCTGASHHPRIVAGIVDLAHSFEVGSPAAVGVAGVLVDRLRHPDEAQLAHVLAGARAVCGDEELIDGAAALLAAATTFLADAIGADPAEVHDEVHRSRSPQRCSSGRRSLCTRVR